MNLMLSELCQQLKKVGAKVIVFMVGHYGPLQEQCIERAAMILAQENPDIRIIAHRECDGVEIDGEMPCDHAGKWETSMFMSMYPELAHMELLRDPPLPQKLYPDAPLDFYRESADWVWETDVHASNPELGRRAVEAAAQNFAGEILAALREL